MSTAVDLDLPRYDEAEVVVPAPASGPGNWAGATTVVCEGDTFWLAYRVRRPVDAGRGVSVVMARSAEVHGSARSARFGGTTSGRPPSSGP